ncbi:glyoxalase superfamily protein [Massilia sp. S19_KUP03_FR1]|uniref:glyoxalase superfamily protein n=1 Tax=Massilia sp. S19_KUP03_FR1 TaxID=3025503 RepID=UPI002FCD6C0C
MKISPAVPILRIFDEAKAREFYVDFLGFTIDWEHRFEPSLPLYMQIRRGELMLHLSGHHGDATPGSALFVRIAGIAELQAELTAKQYGYARPGLVEQDWGTTMEVADPFGNRLRFCQNQD